MTHVLIAGAGIGGLTAALALAETGVAVTVIERSPQLGEAGAGLQISPNAGRVLRRLGLLDPLWRRAFAPRAIHVREARSAMTLSRMPLRDAEARWGAPYLVAHRADLQDVLATAVRQCPSIALHLGTRLAGFGVTASGVVVLAKQDRLTRTLEADALIGADGVRSTVREKLADGASDIPTQTGRTAWRALVPSAGLDALFQAGETGLWLGRDAHLVHYALGDGALVNVVAVVRDAPLDPGPDDLWGTPGDPRVIIERFRRWNAKARTLIAAAPGWQRWPLYDRAPLPAWNAGPVALLGDAAHPILPFLAQGAAQAIEDADALAKALAGEDPIASKLARYSAARQARATRVQHAARRLGHIYHLAGPAALARNLGMRALGAQRLLDRYDWLYGAGAET